MYNVKKWKYSSREKQRKYLREATYRKESDNIFHLGCQELLLIVLAEGNMISPCFICRVLINVLFLSEYPGRTSKKIDFNILNRLVLSSFPFKKKLYDDRKDPRGLTATNTYPTIVLDGLRETTYFPTPSSKRSRLCLLTEGKPNFCGAILHI